MLCKHSLPECATDLLPFFQGALLSAHLTHDDHKFISAEPRHDIAGPCVGAKQRPKLPDHPVSLHVTQHIVDPFQVIQIKEVERCRHVSLAQPLHSVEQPAAVKQPGQIILMGLLPQKMLPRL